MRREKKVHEDGSGEGNRQSWRPENKQQRGAEDRTEPMMSIASAECEERKRVPQKYCSPFRLGIDRGTALTVS